MTTSTAERSRECIRGLYGVTPDTEDSETLMPQVRAADRKSTRLNSSHT